MGKKKSGGGKAKGDKELSKAQRIEAKKAKQAQKSLKKDRKQNDEEDIELLLQEFMKKDAERTAVTVERVGQPSPRANFTMSMLPSGDMLLFGGEYFDGAVNECFNDLFRWNLDAISANAETAAIADEVEESKDEDEDKDERPAAWKQISSPHSPPPRCSHQSVVYRDHLYVFGGEFATADQFHHYRVHYCTATAEVIS